MIALFNYLIFPGFLFSACAGLMACWLDRKVSARLQWRRGPAWHQNFTDILKLLGKENILPVQAGRTFMASPYLGLLSVALVATILGRSIISPLESFAGDLIVVLYLLLIPAVALILGASSSRNPLAAVGASREMKQVLSYELPFILAIITVIIKAGGTIQLGEILNRQINFGSHIFSASGLIAFLVALICIQAKIGIGPFDASEADQELMAGVLIEYSGTLLALFKLTKAILLYCLPLFLIILFLGKDISPLFLTLKYLGILIVLILVKNTNPRLRIDQVMKFFWGPVTLLAVIAVGLALVGR